MWFGLATVLLLAPMAASSGMISLADTSQWSAVEHEVVEFPMPSGVLGPRSECSLTAILQTTADLERLWGDIHPLERAPFGRPPQPDFDFEAKTVVVVSLGIRPTTGYAIEVTGVWECREGLLIEVMYTSPGSGSFVGYTESHPAAAVLVPKRDKSRVFMDVRNQLRRCGDGR